MAKDIGPWIVTVWLNEWPGKNKRKLEFDKITKSLLDAKLAKVRNKPTPQKVHNTWVPPHVVRFDIRKKI